ncbi:hypothetical protein F0358_05185 [Empedobacter brevis]|uniref:hypothetical protein n=1 Tax=Empedobacter brevis TaxID=247 RepID=UPI00123CC66E|nr:hypothetical protein [Empedobacter brevis]QES92153.1 hypothetical protein F0358_05185 [Empedobacter brevis]
MAYHRKNYLEKVLKVQQITLEHRKQGLYFKEIYHQYIEDSFNISKRTYDSYLGINVKKQLKEFAEKV